MGYRSPRAGRASRISQAGIRDAQQLWTVVLAAGASTRLGRPKQLHRYRGSTLLTRTAALAERMTPRRVVIVLGADRLRLRGHLRRAGVEARIAVNRAWQQGMASSLRTGIGALPTRARAALLLLVDQPRVGAADLDRLVACWRKSRQAPVAAHYAGQLGVPAILPRSVFRPLHRLHGDVGARHLLRAAPGVGRVSIAAAAIDLDTPDDVAAL